MPEKKPSVIPTQEQIEAANATGQQIADQFNQEQTPMQSNVPLAEQVAAEEMRKKTEAQIAERERLLQEQHDRAAKLEEERKVYMNQQPPQRPPVGPPNVPTTNGYSNPAPRPSKYEALSQPQMNVQFDVIPLPSDGKLYPSKPQSLKVAYMTTADENIITNPNLLESGDFLEVLFNRKILDQSIRYRDLHVGDRNAIMIWLRATSYGSTYPINLIDPATGEAFEHEFDLNGITTKSLGAEPDVEGYFDFTLPVSQVSIKFKLLTVGEVDDIEDHLEHIRTTLGPEYTDPITFTLATQIVEVNGNRDKAYIMDFASKILIPDADKLREYIDVIESGVDLSLNVEAPSGEVINTFLPLNLGFFWPKLRV